MTTDTDTIHAFPKAPAIYAALVGVMQDIGAIEKAQENKFDRYKFRGIDDLLNALQPALVKHGVVALPDIEDCQLDTYETAKGAIMLRAVMRVRFTFYCAEDGSSVSCTVQGEGADRGDKAVNKAHSSAMKNAMFEALCIPVESGGMIDSETDSPNAKSAPRKRATKKAKPANDPPPPPPEDEGEFLNTKDIQYIRRGLAISRLADLGLEPADGKLMMKDLYRHIGSLVGGEITSLNAIPRANLIHVENFIADWAPRDESPAEGMGVF